MNTEFEQLRSEIQILKNRQEATNADNAQMQTQLQQVKTSFALSQRRLRVQTSLASVAFLIAVFLSPGNRQAIAQGYGVTLQSLANRMTLVENKNVQQDTTLAGLQNQINGSAAQIRSVVVLADGTHPFNQNVTVTHTGTGRYHVVFSPGTFDVFGVPVLTPFNGTGSLSGLSSPGDGSVTFDVSLSGDTPFTLHVLSIN